jgi:hypothetical protein
MELVPSCTGDRVECLHAWCIFSVANGNGSCDRALWFVIQLLVISHRALLQDSAARIIYAR